MDLRGLGPHSPIILLTVKKSAFLPTWPTLIALGATEAAFAGTAALGSLAAVTGVGVAVSGWPVLLLWKLSNAARIAAS